MASTGPFPLEQIYRFDNLDLTFRKRPNRFPPPDLWGVATQGPIWKEFWDQLARSAKGKAGGELILYAKYLPKLVKRWGR